MSVFQDGQFLDVEFDGAPYTHVLIDIELEVCGIARKPNLAHNTITIARRFVELLQDADLTGELQARLEVEQIKDPSEFISFLERAVAIRRFAFTITRPNPFDVDADFVRPLEESLEQLNGTSGKVDLRGDSLDSTRLAELARSAASTGADADAQLKLDETSGFVKKSLNANLVSTILQDDSIHNKREILNRIRDTYDSVRTNPGG